MRRKFIHYNLIFLVIVCLITAFGTVRATSQVTQSPVEVTSCPAYDTYCPASETRCPIIETKCPPLVTECVVAETRCPPIETRCPVIKTKCPPVETECVVAETKCPPVETRCPIIRTKCPPVETECIMVETKCPPVETRCPVIQTKCPPSETKCPPSETWCPVIETKCPRDTTPPELQVSVYPDILWPPNHKMVLVTPTIEVFDNHDTYPIVNLVSITMNEGDETNTYHPDYDTTTGDGHTVNDIQVDEFGYIYLRAERSGNGTGRIYEIAYTATDTAGNYTTEYVYVTVPHDL